MLIMPQNDEQLCPICSAGWAGSGGRVVSLPLTLWTWLTCALITPSHSLLRDENADQYFPNHQKKAKVKETAPKVLCYSIKSNKRVRFQCTLLESFPVYLICCFHKGLLTPRTLSRQNEPIIL